MSVLLLVVFDLVVHGGIVIVAILIVPVTLFFCVLACEFGYLFRLFAEPFTNGNGPLLGDFQALLRFAAADDPPQFLQPDETWRVTGR